MLLIKCIHYHYKMGILFLWESLFWDELIYLYQVISPTPINCWPWPHACGKVLNSFSQMRCVLLMIPRREFPSVSECWMTFSKTWRRASWYSKCHQDFIGRICVSNLYFYTPQLIFLFNFQNMDLLWTKHYFLT